MKGLQTCHIPKGHITYLIYAQGDKCLLRKLTIVRIILESHFVQFLQVFSIKCPPSCSLKLVIILNELGIGLFSKVFRVM